MIKNVEVGMRNGKELGIGNAECLDFGFRIWDCGHRNLELQKGSYLRNYLWKLMNWLTFLLHSVKNPNKVSAFRIPNSDPFSKPLVVILQKV